jgi:hypothetical protein
MLASDDSLTEKVEFCEIHSRQILGAGIAWVIFVQDFKIIR